VTFVDTNVFMYAVGRPHPLRDEAREFFKDTLASGEILVTSVEVLQELMHAYLPVGRLSTLDSALNLARARMAAIWPIQLQDLELARAIADVENGLAARDLLHLACTRRRSVHAIKTFDRALAAAAERV
jgi:predicted nucleic acid-binding protein